MCVQCDVRVVRKHVFEYCCNRYVFCCYCFAVPFHFMFLFVHSYCKARCADFFLTRYTNLHYYYYYYYYYPPVVGPSPMQPITSDDLTVSVDRILGVNKTRRGHERHSEMETKGRTRLADCTVAAAPPTSPEPSASDRTRQPVIQAKLGRVPSTPGTVTVSQRDVCPLQKQPRCQSSNPVF